MNDLVRPSFSVAAVGGCLDEMFSALTASGARVATLTFPDLPRGSARSCARCGAACSS
jgi:hypothetical protein